MKLKYYLRGLGIGIIGTAIVMGIALSGKKETLSDAEIIERARLLGMEMEGELGPDKKDPEQENLEGQEPGTAPEGETGQDEAGRMAGNPAAAQDRTRQKAIRRTPGTGCSSHPAAVGMW